MTFGVDLIPNNNTQQRTLGNDQSKWNINANTITATTINGNNVTNGVKATQSAIADPTAEGTSLEFIDSISQNTQGVITPTKKTVASATTSTAGLMSAADKTKLNGIETGAEVNPDIANNLIETTAGKVLDATQGKVLNDTKLDKDFNFTAATLPYSNLEKLALRGTDGNNYYTTIGELASQIGGSGGGTSQTALVHYIKNCGTISSLNWTNPTIDNNITENMVVLKAELSNPAAQTSDWTCTTTNGYVTISGTISGSTDVLLYFGVSLSTAPSIIVNLASNSSDNVLKTNPTPGVMGVLGTANGGTGVSATDAADLRSKLGIIPANIGAVSLSEVRYTGNISADVVTPGYTGGGEQFFKAALKYIAEHFNNAGAFVGTMSPNSRGPFIGNIYDVNDRDSSTGLPRYSTFIFHNLYANVESFGTDNYTFYYRTYYSSKNVVPLVNGGTEATNAPDARSNLDVYSKSEVDNAIQQSTANTRTDFAGLVIYDYYYYVWVPMDSVQLNKNIMLASIASIVIPNIMDITQYKSAISKKANGIYISFSSSVPDISSYVGKAVSLTITI